MKLTLHVLAGFLIESEPLMTKWELSHTSQGPSMSHAIGGGGARRSPGPE